MEPGDLFARLRAANPVPDARTAGRRASTDADELLSRITRSRPRPRRAVLVAIAIALLLVSALAAFAIVRASRAQQQTRVACYESADLSSRQVLVPNLGDPVGACAQAWAAGTLGSGPVPHFAPCVTPADSLGVFPGESGTTCESLGLPVAIVDQDAGTAFAADLGSRMRTRCRDEADARKVIEQRLRAYGLTSWLVTVQSEHPLTSAEPCASVNVAVQAKQVIIVAAPRSAFP